jgi:hypothetical protein
MAALENDWVLPVTRRRRLQLFSNGPASNDELVDLQSVGSGATDCQTAHSYRTNRSCTHGDRATAKVPIAWDRTPIVEIFRARVVFIPSA